MPGGSTKKLKPSEQRRSEERLAKYGPKKEPLEEKTFDSISGDHVKKLIFDESEKVVVNMSLKLTCGEFDYAGDAATLGSRWKTGPNSSSYMF